MTVGSLRMRFIGDAALNQSADALLRASLDDAKERKKRLREALVRLQPALPVPSPRPGVGGQLPRERTAPPQLSTDAIEEDLVTDPTCDVKFDATRRVTEVLGGAKVRRSLAELAPILDPRSWSCGGGVIAQAFIVDEDADGVYRRTTELDETVPLGRPWANRLLWEYARSEVASFENILRIVNFDVAPNEIQATYHLHDCLICTLGAFSSPGGLTINEGHVKATRIDAHWSQIEVLKRLEVRDLTPNDPGNPYDFGQSVNLTIGTALTVWVQDTGRLSPVL
jgi:hypothetical protein